jgi:hypothetical protein
MSAFIPNTRVTVLDTGVVKDDLGDEAENWVAAAEHLPAFWAQKDERTWDPVQQRVTILRGYLVVLRPGTSVTEAQRLRNERTGEIGQVRTVDSQATLGVAGDVHVRLIRVSGKPF